MTKARRISQPQPDPEALCKQCDKIADDDERYLVVAAPTGTEHLIHEGENETLCGRDTTDW